jgi:hypothetical protein
MRIKAPTYHGMAARKNPAMNLWFSKILKLRE